MCVRACVKKVSKQADMGGKEKWRAGDSPTGKELAT